jgi:hypothetical protein
MNYSISITTFSLRFEMVEKLVNQIRSFTNVPINICINGEYKKDFIEDYRRKMLKLCLEHDYILPIFFSEMRGLSKMWNTLISLSNFDNILVLNDDIEILSNDIFQKISDLNSSNLGITKINNSFSHFLVNKEIIDKIGWFDERLIGFGEEDGDITFRIIEMGYNIDNLNVPGLLNIVSDIRHNIKSGIGKYSLFNREFTFDKKYQRVESDVVIGMFGEPHKKILSDFNALPYEKFYWENKDKLSND